MAARDRERAQRAAVREHEAAIRRAEQARRAAERAQAQYGRATEAERKRLDKEVRNAHVAAMEAEVEGSNLALAEAHSEIDSLLEATLGVDDYVDLETLRTPAQHPPFDRSALEIPIPAPPALPDPPEPVFQAPPPPSGLSGLFGKKKHAEAVAAAEVDHQRAVEQWRAEVEAAAGRRAATAEQHAQKEADRLAALQAEVVRYQAECAAREHEAAERSKALDQLIANLGYGTVEAVQEYVSIVLSNSVYPEHFPVAHEFIFDPGTAELQLRVLIPGPEAVPDVKAYKYTKASDSITSVSLGAATLSPPRTSRHPAEIPIQARPARAKSPHYHHIPNRNRPHQPTRQREPRHRRRPSRTRRLENQKQAALRAAKAGRLRRPRH
ncbi:MAG TPA: hypothetical protein VK988_14565 [Acidimicrobiales bacterium]|nr:hypothetical protein [Acidimicrobiales bacterium]